MPPYMERQVVVTTLGFMMKTDRRKNRRKRQARRWTSATATRTVQP